MIDDIEVARYALRTFKVDKRELQSPVKSGSYWRDGTCKAQCLAVGSYDNKKHLAPHESCSCGIYGTLNLAALLRQFDEAKQLVTVIAAEGTTIIGDTGLKTAYARVVAYWTPRSSIRKKCGKQFQGATHFGDLDEMLAAYKLPREPLPPPPCCEYRKSHPQGSHFCGNTLLGPLTAGTAARLAEQYAQAVGNPTYLSLLCNGVHISGPQKVPLLVSGSHISWASTTFVVPAMCGELAITLSPTPDGPPVDKASCGWFTFANDAQVVVTPQYVVAYS